MAQINFNAAAVEPQQTTSVIPAGKYTVVIEESELKSLNSGKGDGLNLRMRVVEGQYQNRVLFSLLCVRHENEQTQQIAQQQLSAICRAVGVGLLSDTVQLHNKPLIATVKIRKSEQYGDQNSVSAYEPASANSASFTAPQVPASPSQPSGGATPPWAKK